MRKKGMEGFGAVKSESGLQSAAWLYIPTQSHCVGPGRTFPQAQGLGACEAGALGCCGQE